ncbi:MAG: hypothetical protein AAFQ66_12860, partial [Pseudomonadota bacterium]
MNEKAILGGFGALIAVLILVALFGSGWTDSDPQMAMAKQKSQMEESLAAMDARIAELETELA